MFVKIFFSFILLSSSLSFARGHRPPPLTDEAKAAIEECGLSLPEPGQRPNREQHEAIRECLDEAGIERPVRRAHGERRDSGESVSR